MFPGTVGGDGRRQNRQTSLESGFTIRQATGRGGGECRSQAEALCCLLHFMLLMEPGNHGLQLAIQSQKDIKEPQGES